MDANEPGTIRMKLHKLGWIQQRLLVGDYWFFAHNYKKVGIERKTVEDFLGSMGDKLSRQLENNLEHYNISILLLEGSWRKVNPSQNLVTQRGIVYQTWDMAFNYIRRFQDKGMTLELTVDQGHTVHRLNELYALYQKSYSLSARSKEFTDDRVLAFPSGVRGKSGMKVLEGRSLADIGLMEVEDFIEIEGVGKKRAQLIYDHFNRRDNARKTPPEN
jgi:ERCC4-type nuclease